MTSCLVREHDDDDVEDGRTECFVAARTWRSRAQGGRRRHRRRRGRAERRAVERFGEAVRPRDSGSPLHRSIAVSMHTLHTRTIGHLRRVCV